MRLKCIKLAGFKSFVDPTTVNFPSNLCAVVGPNGCGKSNVIDAVRWVMGESSAKHLRGESMTDVIFNGSGGRKPVGQASIELVFDNSEGTLKGEYISYAEISIKRKVTRDGQSGYFLNGNKCRRRDITDIFLGTGLGPRSYAIIEQGMISNLIEAKPDDLRVYIEEAAGISKYKERRRDTENRIRRTQENLERLTDIREELGRQLQRLERQAQAAEKYAEFKKEERRVKAQLQALRWRIMDAQVADQRSAITRRELDVEALVTARSSCETAGEKLRSQYLECSDGFNDIQGRYYAVGAEVARVEQSIQHARDRARELRQDMEQTERNYVETEQHLATDRQKALGWEAELQEIRPAMAVLGQAEQESTGLLQAAEEAMHQWQIQWDEFNQQATAPRQQAEVQQSRIQHLEQVLRRLAERVERLQGEHRDLDTVAAEEEIAGLREQLAQQEIDNEQQQALINRLVCQIDEGRKNYQQVASALGATREQLQALKGRQASLLALQQAALDDGGDQKQWLQARGLEQRPRLAETLSVSDGWELAVETVLGSYLQAVCVDQLQPLIADALDLQAGDLLMLEPAGADADGQHSAAMAAHPGAEPLSTRLRGDRDAAGLLNGIFACDSLEQALQWRPQLQPGQSVITRDGIWLGANWLRVSRDKDASVGVLKRKQELDAIADQLRQSSARAEELAEAMHQSETRLASMEQQREQHSRGIAEQQRHYAELRSRVSASEMQLEQYRARRARADRELTEAREQQGIEQENLAEARQWLQQALDSMEVDTRQREDLLRQRDGLRSQLDQSRQRARHDRDRLHELAIREKSVSTQLLSIRDGIARLEIQVERLQQRRSQLQESFSQQDDPSEDLAVQLEQLLEQRLAVEAELGEARRNLETVEHEMRQREQQRSQLEQQILEGRSELEQLRLACQEVETRCKTIVEQITEHKYQLQGLLDELPEDAEPGEWEQELERIGNRIQRLGAINLAAIEEYKIESERKSYLDAQHDDLTEALETLESAIRKIDKETRTRFRETFDQINTSLQTLFPKLFGGGHAYLELTGDDLLDTGVTIMARPPGKKNTTIHLLSGGEKAMTAIALVFSIFKLNPAPFCMLDEVDAPLDDANVGRYARMVSEMSDSVQFIYITHNKIAMEMAHQLMGVTMHEPGVSRLVSVDVEQAAELAEA